MIGGAQQRKRGMLTAVTDLARNRCKYQARLDRVTSPKGEWSRGDLPY